MHTQSTWQDCWCLSCLGGEMSRDKELWSSCLFTSLSQQPDSSHTLQTKADGFRESQEKSVSFSFPYPSIYLCPYLCLFLSFSPFLNTFGEKKLLNFILFTTLSFGRGFCRVALQHKTGRGRCFSSSNWAKSFKAEMRWWNKKKSFYMFKCFSNRERGGNVA